MSSRTRYALVVLSALGLAASLAALYVHYRLITEPGIYELLRHQRNGVVRAGVRECLRDRSWCAGGCRRCDLVRARPDVLRMGHAQAQVGWGLARRRLRVPALHGWSRRRLLLRVRLVLRPAPGVPALPDDVRERDWDLPALIWRGRTVAEMQSGVAKDLGGLKGSPTAALLAVVWLVASAGLVLAFPRASRRAMRSLHRGGGSSCPGRNAGTRAAHGGSRVARSSAEGVRGHADRATSRFC